MAETGAALRLQHEEEAVGLIRLINLGPFEVDHYDVTELGRPSVGVKFTFYFADRLDPDNFLWVSAVPRYTYGHEGGRLRLARHVEQDLFNTLQRRRDSPYGAAL